MFESLLFIPNIIGYIRLILLYKYISTNIIYYYIASYLLDIFDGYFARKLNQESTLGYYLDMLTDRLASLVIIVKAINFINYRESNFGSIINSSLYLFFLLVFSIELLSHLVVLIHSKKKNIHQKDIIPPGKIGKAYLSENRLFMLTSIFSFEAFFVTFLLFKSNLFLIFLPGLLFRLEALRQRMIFSYKNLINNKKN